MEEESTKLVENNVKNNDGINNSDVQNRIVQMEEENRKMQEHFNMQRAKLKELFLQKEEELNKKNQENLELLDQLDKLRRELDDTKSQLVVDSITLESNFEAEKRRAEAEIATLQQLIHETVEESSSTRSLYDTELQRLRTYIEQFQRENSELRRQISLLHHSTPQEQTLGPSVVLNALTKGIAKKLGADLSQENSDESRKVQEDAEVLRSLVEPLEDQIKALKEKLRSTDEKLQKCRECGHTEESNLNPSAATNTSFDKEKANNCDMCSNYEAQLVSEQKKTSELENKLIACEKAVERHKEDLLKEIGFRKDMEEKWNEKKEEHKQQVAELTRITECTEQDLKELQKLYDQTCKEMRESLMKLTQDRQTVNEELEKLQEEIYNLVGKYTIHSQELQSQVINLPNTVDELHELLLQNHQDLIIAKIGKESAEDKVNQLLNDIQLRDSLETGLKQEIAIAKKQLHELEKERKTHQHHYEKLLAAEKQQQAKNSELEEKIVELNATIIQLEAANNELRTRVYSLQQELDTTETVQKDFVRLSQSLQVQLEKIRESDTQVRWQHEDDVNECPNCRQTFQHGKKKQHCRHCGQIFCQSCLSHTVNSGPNLRPSKVCDVCHTLLVKSSAPYFSEAPPMT